MSLALVATGFAAWVLSNDASEELEGKVEIAAVHEESVDISNIQFIKDDPTNDAERADSFIFEPQAGDTTGRVRYDGSSHPENLDVKFQWTIDNYQIVGEIFVDFKIPANVYKALDAENGWLYIDRQNADTGDNTGFKVIGDETKDGKDYKVLRYVVQTAQGAINASGQTEDGVVKYEVAPGDVVNTVTFTMNIAFEWGDTFHGDNPGEYYDQSYQDDPAAGSAVDFQTMKDTLNTFKATLHGIDPADYIGLEEDAQKALCEEPEHKIPNYIIVINAQVA